jgi:DNA-binding NtrC family response regulator
MTIEEIREELLNKIHELEWRNNVRSLELINWMQDLLKKTEPKQAPIKKEIKVEVDENASFSEEASEELEEQKKDKVSLKPKRKITFKKK